MRYRKLGRTGVEVSTQCLGTMMLGAMGNANHDDCIRLIHTALDAGINFVDTADVYSAGESEEIVGKALKGRRDEVVLATKVFSPMGPARNRQGSSRRWIIEEVENSLRRLQVDHIDLYQIHRFDWNVEIDDTLSALSDLVHSGKVRYVGSSTWPADKIVEGQWIAERRGRERFICEQPQYSIFARSVEAAVLPAARSYGMGVIPWSPLAGGWLAGKYRRGGTPEVGSRYAEGSPWARRMGAADTNADPRIELVEQLAVVAEQAGTSLTGLSLGFVDAHPAVTAAIIGPRTMDQLEGLLAVADVELDAGTLDAIDAICAPGVDAPGIGHNERNLMLDAVNRRR